MSGTPIAIFDPPTPANAVERTYEEIVNALLAGQRGIGVLAAEPSVAAILLRTIPISQRLAKFRFLRFTPASPLKLTLENVAFQAGLDLPHGEVDAAAIFATLKAHQPASGCTALIVEAAETLSAEALTFFEQVATPSLSAQPMQLVLIGRGSFGELLQAEQFPQLWSITERALSVAGAVPDEARPPAAEEAHHVDTASFSTYAIAPSYPRVWPKVALGLVVLVAGAALYAMPWFNPVAPPDRKPVVPAVVAPAIVAPVAPPVAAAPPLPAKQLEIAPVVTTPPVEVQAKPALPPEPSAPLAAPSPPNPADGTRQQLRQRFDAFLDKAGRDTASLTHDQRDALFEKYLASHPAASTSP